MLYAKEKSFLFECCLLPTLSFNKQYNSTLKPQIEALLQPYKERIQHYCLHYKKDTFLVELLTELPTMPDTLDAFLTSLPTIEVNYIYKTIARLLNQDTTDTHISKDDALTCVSQSDLSVAEKWYFSELLIDPTTFLQELAALIQAIADDYREIYQLSQAERDQLAQTFSLDQLAIIDADTRLQFAKKSITLLVFSPYINYIFVMGNPTHPNDIWIGVSEQITAMQTQNKAVLDGQDLAAILKTLSDNTRYQVLSLLAQPNMKTKDIAEQLHITSAAVSYHTNKLLAQNLLVANVNIDDKDVRYTINEQTLQQVIHTLINDFNIEK